MAHTGRDTRAYRSPGRDEQARRTRRRVLDAARALLVEQGYAAVSMTAIAARAEVSVALLYKTFTSKPELVKEVYDVTLAGDDVEQPIAAREEIAEVLAEPDPRGKLARYARLSRVLSGRAGALAVTLREAARGGQAELVPFLQATDTERLVGATRLAQHLADAGMLRLGLTVERARDLLWMTTSPEAFTLLTRDRGWSLDDYESWVLSSLEAALLEAPSGL
jgi:AcrR family transcriptional regulator